VKSINSMLKQLHGLLDTQDLTPWQQSFVRSCWSRSEEGTNTARLTEKQVELVPEIYSKHFGD
jgi:hypothetical protein